MDKERIISCLIKLGFSRLEAEIYLVLLDGAKSGYQIAKKIDISRPSVYNALEHMYDDGIILQLQDNSSEYVAQPPEIIFKRLNEEYTENALFAEKVLTEYTSNRFEERLATFKGLKSVITRAKQMIADSKQEVFINTDMDISCFKDEINSTAKSGTNIYVFSFYKLNADDIQCTTFSHEREPLEVSTRLMISSDRNEILVANKSSENGEWIAFVTNNPLMTDIITEHIHHDIYLLKLRREHGPDMYNSLRIGSEFEELNRIKK